MTKHLHLKKVLALLLTMAALVAGQNAWAQGLSGSGTTEDPYLITNNADWVTFAQSVTNDSTYAGQTVKLTADIYVTEMVGLYRAFSGTLDGDGHTITLALSGGGEGTALFYWIENATLKNLKAQGTVTTTDRRPATFAIIVFGNSTISNCWSTVAVSSTRTSGWVDGGGFVGRVSNGATLNMTDCAFHGSVTFTPSATTGGGMVGYTQSNATVNLTNCLYSPTALTLNVSEYNPRVFVSGSVEGNLTNCYYNNVAATSVLENQGTDASGMSNEELATALGPNWKITDGLVVPFLSMYYIGSASEWHAFTTTLNNGTSFNGQTVVLTTDIPTAEEIANGTTVVTTMAGTESHPFRGTLDGGGHTITLGLSGSGQGTALFYLIEGATLKNLKVQGTVTTTEYRPATFAAFVEGNCTISNCWSTVAVSSTKTNSWVDGGGFVGCVKSGATLNMAGCAFHGSVTFTPSATTGGGMVGFTQTGAAVNLTDCLYSPTALTLNVHDYYPFIFVSGIGVAHLTNCYYNDVAAASALRKDGKLMHSITAGEYVTVAFDGEATSYDMSGISAYSVGLVYDSTLYAGQGETVSLNLACTPPPGYDYSSFVASSGTLNGTENPYTLTMPNEDVTIVLGYTVSVVCTPNIADAAQVSLDNTHWSSSVNAAVGQEVYFKANDVIGYRRAGYTIETENGEWVNCANGHFTMPAANVTYYADFLPDFSYTNTVTFSPGLVGGEPIVYTFDPATAALNAASAENLQFYYVNYNTLGFRLPNDYLPNSFIEPYEGAFLGWDGWSNDGYITLTSTATTFTAQWFYYIVTLSPGVGGGEPIVYAFNPETVAPNAATAQNWQFYYVSNDEAGFRLGDDCPNSFTAPEGLGFSGWSNSGYVTLTSGATTFTVQWGTPGTPVNYIDENGEMHTCSNYTVLTGGSYYYTGVTLEAGWYVVDSDITYYNLLGSENTLNLNGDVTLIFCNGKTVTHNPRQFVHIHGHDHNLTIYGQSLDPNVAGTLNIAGKSGAITDLTTYTQHSGNVVIPSGSNGIHADFLTINGGTVHIDTDFAGLIGDNVVINGGKVETNEILAGYNITLGYTRPDDYILAGQYYYNYFNNGGTVSVKSGQTFYYENNEGEIVTVSGTIANPNSTIAWKTLRPYGLATYTLTPTAYALTNSGYTDIPCTLSSLELLEVWNGSSMVPATGLSFYMNGGTLTDSIGNSIPFLVDNGSHSGAATRKAQGGVFSSEGDTLIMAVYIDPEVYDTLAPGTYTGTFDYDSYWNENPDIHGLSGSIALTLEKSESSTVTQTVTLAAGTNWFSTNVEITLDDLKAALVEALPGTNITIKSRTKNIAYNPNNHRWTGQLTSFDVTQMYMISVSADCEMTLSGTPINPAEHPVTIQNGSNWIAFPFSENMAISNAFAGFAVNGDKVKSRNNNTQYLGNSWRGQLNTLLPGQGYMYISNTQETRTFTFPISTK